MLEKDKHNPARGFDFPLSSIITGTMNPYCPPDCVDARVMSRVIAAASDLALVVDQQGVIKDVAIGESVQPGHGFGSLIGKRWVETIAMDSQAKVEQLLQEARAGGTPRAREINQQADGAGEIPFRFSAVLLGSPENTQQVVALGRDLRPLSVLQQQMLSTQQAMDREYARLRQAETRYRLLFQVTAEAVLVADAASLKVVESNPAAVALVEQSAQAVQGKTLRELFSERSWPQVQAYLTRIESGARLAEVSASLPGGEREVILSASLFRQSGTSLLLLRLRPAGAAPETLSGRDSRMLAVLDALPDSLVIIGEDRRILAANPAFCDLIQLVNENQVIGQPLDRWLGRPGVDLNIMLANLREHGTVRNFATIIRGEYGTPQEAVVSAVSAPDAKVPCLGFAIRTVPVRLTVVPPVGPTPRSVDQLRELVGRVALKEIVREASDMIERLCIEAALQVSGDNRASAAQLLGLSRQGLYSKLRRHGLGDLDSTDPDSE